MYEYNQDNAPTNQSSGGWFSSNTSIITTSSVPRVKRVTVTETEYDEEGRVTKEVTTETEYTDGGTWYQPVPYSPYIYPYTVTYSSSGGYEGPGSPGDPALQ